MDRSLELKLIDWNYNPIPKSMLDLKGVPAPTIVSPREAAGIIKKAYEEAQELSRNRFRGQDGNMILFDGSSRHDGLTQITIRTHEMTFEMENPALAVMYGSRWSFQDSGLYIFSPEDTILSSPYAPKNVVALENHGYHVGRLDGRELYELTYHIITLPIGRQEGLIRKEFTWHALITLPAHDDVKISVLPRIDDSQRDKLLEKLKTKS